MRLHCSQIWLYLQLHVIRTWAFPNGASTTACGSMTPGHGAKVNELAPYTLDTGGVTEYTPDTPITVTVRGGAFAGILLQARNVNLARTMPLGTFQMPTPDTFLRLLKCNNVAGSAITHGTTNGKMDSVVVWRPPDTDVGEIQFVATIALSKEGWWKNIRSQLLVYRAATIPTSVITVRPTPVIHVSTNQTISSANSITFSCAFVLLSVHLLYLLLELR